MWYQLEAILEPFWFLSHLPLHYSPYVKPAFHSHSFPFWTPTPTSILWEWRDKDRSEMPGAGQGSTYCGISGLSSSYQATELMWRPLFLRFILVKFNNMANLLQRMWNVWIMDNKSRYNQTNARHEHCTFWYEFTAFVGVICHASCVAPVESSGCLRVSMWAQCLF